MYSCNIKLKEQFDNVLSLSCVKILLISTFSVTSNFTNYLSSQNGNLTNNY